MNQVTILNYLNTLVTIPNLYLHFTDSENLEFNQIPLGIYCYRLKDYAQDILPNIKGEIKFPFPTTKYLYLVDYSGKKCLDLNNYSNLEQDKLKIAAYLKNNYPLVADDYSLSAIDDAQYLVNYLHYLSLKINSFYPFENTAAIWSTLLSSCCGYEGMFLLNRQVVFFYHNCLRVTGKYAINRTFDLTKPAMKHPYSLPVSPEKYNEEQQLIAVKNNPEIICSLRQVSEKVQLAAVSEEGSVLGCLIAKYGHENIAYKVKLKAVETTPDAIYYVENPTNEMQQIAISADTRLFHHILNPAGLVQSALLPLISTYQFNVYDFDEETALKILKFYPLLWRKIDISRKVDYHSSQIHLFAVKRNPEVIKQMKGSFYGIPNGILLYLQENYPEYLI